MITGAKLARRARRPTERTDKGQSILEFLLVLPAVIGIALLMIRVNSAIQVGIVNQQYARAQALYLALNNHSYPRLGLAKPSLIDAKMNQMILGISDHALPEGESNFEPDPSTVSLGSKAPGASEEKGYVTKRNNVRIRTTVTLCTPTYTVSNGSAVEPLLDIAQGASGGADQSFVAKGAWKLNEQTTFNYCSVPSNTYGESG